MRTRRVVTCPPRSSTSVLVLMKADSCCALNPPLWSSKFQSKGSCHGPSTARDRARWTYPVLANITLPTWLGPNAGVMYTVCIPDTLTNCGETTETSSSSPTVARRYRNPLWGIFGVVSHTATNMPSLARSLYPPGCYRPLPERSAHEPRSVRDPAMGSILPHQGRGRGDPWFAICRGSDDPGE